MTNDPEINVQRVHDRVAAGGHGVPEDKIRSRYHLSLKNLSKLVRIADMTRIIDNSGAEMRYLASYSEEDGVDLLVPESDLPKWFMVATSKEQQK